jgi:hypothetical protein
VVPPEVDPPVDVVGAGQVLVSGMTDPSGQTCVVGVVDVEVEIPRKEFTALIFGAALPD